MEKFEKLKALWDRKLKDSGFEDIENKDGSLRAEADARTIAQGFKDGRAEYYAQALNFLNSHSFLISNDYRIWKGHCDGISFRTLAKLEKMTFYKIRTIVNKYQKLSGIKK